MHSPLPPDDPRKPPAPGANDWGPIAKTITIKAKPRLGLVAREVACVREWGKDQSGKKLGDKTKKKMRSVTEREPE
jgi:hypothetical protein